MSSMPHPPAASTTPPRWRGELAAVAACALTAALLAPFHDRIDLANTALLLTLVVALIAFRLGRRPAIVAAFTAVALFDFVFVPPRWSFAVSDVQYLLIFVVMLAVGLIITHLTQRLQARGDEALERERQARALYGLAGTLAGAVDNAAVATALRDFVAAGVGGHARLLLVDAAGVLVAVDAEKALPDVDAALARATLVDGHPHRCANPADDLGLRLLLPLPGATCVRGVLLVDAGAQEADALRDAEAMLEAVAALAATAVDRLHYVAVAQQVQLEASAERLRSSILSALSHDLRTPLTALYGLADSLRLEPLPEPARETAATIADQARRLGSMVGKLLDLARLKSGPLRLRREWQPLEEVVGSSLALLGPALDGHPVAIELPPELPLLEFDAVLIERVLGNLLENAAKYGPPDGEIAITASVAADHVEVAVADRGSGFAPGTHAHVFDAFVRCRHDPGIAGSGLGLAICRAIVEAHGGRISAADRPGGGARVAFTLPRGTPPAIEDERE